VRKLLADVLRDEADLTAFCLDYFPKVACDFASGQTRSQRENLLLERESPADILARLSEREPPAVLASLESDGQPEIQGTMQPNCPAPCGRLSSSQPDNIATAPSGGASQGANFSAYVPADGGFGVLKSSDSRFVGRKDVLLALKKGFKSKAIRIAVLQGPGGIGKSSVLYRFWKQIASDFRACLYIDCNTSPDSVQLLTKLSDWLLFHGSPVLAAVMRDGSLPLQDKLLIAVRILEDGGPYLLAFDNFESMLQSSDRGEAPADEGVMMLLSLLAGGAPKNKVLIASRMRFVLDAQESSVVWVPIYDLSEDESTRVMRKLPRLRRRGTQQDFVELWRIGVRSPRLIELVEAELEDYDLDDVKAHLQHLESELIETQQLERIYTKLSEQAQTLLRRASVYREPVSLDMLIAHLPDGARDYRSALKQLRDRSLLSVTEINLGKGGRTHYRIHETTRRWAAQKLLEQEGESGVKQAQRRAGYAYLREFDKVPRPRAIFYAAAGWYWLQQAGELALAAQLASAMAPVIIRQVHPQFAHDILQEVLRGLLKGNPTAEHEARVRLLLGIILFRQGRSADARGHWDRALSIAQTHGNRAIEVAVLEGLALMQVNEGDLAAAQTLATKILQLSCELKDSRQLAHCHYCLGSIEQACLRLDTAFNHFLKLPPLVLDLLPSEEKAAQDDAPLVSKLRSDEDVLTALLSTLQSISDFSFSIDVSTSLTELTLVFTQATSQGTNLAPNLEPLKATSKVLGQLAIAQQDAVAVGQILALHALFAYVGDDEEKFLVTMQLSLEISTKQGDLRGVLSRTAMLAEHALSKGRPAAARDHYLQALMLEEQLGGRERPGTFVMRGRLATVLAQLGEHTAARAQLQQALTASERLARHSMEAAVLQAGLLLSLSQIEAATGNHAQARNIELERTALLERLAREQESKGQQSVATELRRQLGTA